MFRLPPELDPSSFAAPAPIRVASIREAQAARHAAVDPVAMAAALPAPLRRILLLAADDVAGRGYPVWAIAAVAGWSDEVTFARADRLSRLRLVQLRLAYEDRDMDVIPTPAGRRVAALLLAWRS